MRKAIQIIGMPLALLIGWAIVVEVFDVLASQYAIRQFYSDPHVDGFLQEASRFNTLVMLAVLGLSVLHTINSLANMRIRNRTVVERNFTRRMLRRGTLGLLISLIWFLVGHVFCSLFCLHSAY
jgi:ABC-type antimicrobial peptide transport system permease subunit